MRGAHLWLIAVACLPIAGSRAEEEAPWKRPLARDEEMALALTALPESLRGGAAVFVLEKTGYVKAREGTSGIACLVEREAEGGRAPACWDREGVETILPVMLEKARLRAEGRSEEDVGHEIARGFESGRFRAPRRAGVSYMISEENHVWNGRRVVTYRPHVMIYAPYVTNADIGADLRDPRMPWVLGEGTPHAYIIVPTIEENR
jgi:hypothetical protein